MALYEAEQIYRSKQNLDSAVILYNNAFAGGATNASVVFDAISCATTIKDDESAVDFMEYGFLIGLKVVDYRNSWNWIGKGRDFNSIISKCDTISNHVLYEQSLDTELIDQINFLAIKDQEYRSDDDDNWNLQRRNDSLNWSELKRITEYLSRIPSYTEIGIDGADNLEILFYHMDREIIEWFLPYVFQSIKEGESNLAEIILYQLDRIGMDEGIIYTITEESKIERLAERTKMKNNYYCQSFGEWFKEKSMIDNELYFVPIDPNIPLDEVNRVRALFYLDSIESKWKRQPWVNVVSIEEFVRKFE